MILRRDKIADKISEYVRKQVPFVFIIDFSGTLGVVLTPDEAARENIFFSTPGFTNFKMEAPSLPSLLDFQFFPVGLREYSDAFRKIMAHLQRGDTYLLNLTFPTPILTSFSLTELFSYSIAPYKLLFKDRFVVFSPEIFVRIAGNQIFSYPMKGTIDASIPGAKEKILADQKEFFEHNTIVDLIRNDLSIVSYDVRVNRFRYVEPIVTNRKTLLQVSSEISGTLFPDWKQDTGALLLKLLPAGSVTGAPKGRTVEIIRDVETYERGFYTGVFGYCNGEDIDSAVMIRFIEQTDGKMVFKSGGGITSLSKLNDEYDELNQKIYVPVA